MMRLDMAAGGAQRVSFTGHFAERLSKSIEYLSFKAQSHNALAAHDHVSAVISEQKKYALYRDLFPAEWATSQASFYRRGYFVKYSERANELFRLVNDKCFPLLEYWHDDPESEFEHFAIPPLNVDLCCEEIYFEELRLSYAAGLLFYVRDDAWGFFKRKFGVSASDFPTIEESPHKSIWDKDGCIFGDLLRLVDHSTGNPWLDSDYCQMADWYEFNRETIEELTREYKAARDAFDRLDTLDAMIEADPKKMLSALIDFWNNGNAPDDTTLTLTNGSKTQ
ncbi:MAG TPA: hypothetical protein PKD24_04400 [Pyrinomonadaceae bacterium]|nr:hypothetical protein [Pyrinomonadaceae bacterium]HMP64791.1 hypothetical protein [Pyrinomonadaceae bacterium]